mgnify:FL=1
MLKLPFYSGCIYISLLLGAVTMVTFLNNPLAVSGYISFMLETIFPVFMIWVAFKDSDSLLKLIKMTVSVYVIMALYGVIAYWYGGNPLLELINTEDSPRRLLFTYNENERGGVLGRAQSIFSHPLHLGYLSSIMAVMVFGIQKAFRPFSTIAYWLVLFILLVSIMLASSRSPILFLIISIIVYTAYSGLINALKIFAFTFLGLVLVISSGIYESVFGNYLELIVSIFEELSGKESGFGGSDLDMRLSQLAIALNVFLERPLFGHGMSYIRILLENHLAPGLLEAESFAFKMIDVGVVGMFGYLLLYVKIYSSFWHDLWRNKLRQVRVIAMCGIAMLGGHLAFIFATGEMGMLNIYLILSTLLLRLIYLFKAEQDESVIIL